MRRYIVLVVSVVLVALVLAACNRGGGGQASDTWHIKLKEYEFVPNTIRVKAGHTVKITLENVGKKDHEFIVGNNVDTSSGHPDGFLNPFLSENEFNGIKAEQGGKSVPPSNLIEEEDIAKGGIAAIDAGSPAVTVQFVVPNKPGEWQIGCFKDNGDHWDEGMRGKLIVEK